MSEVAREIDEAFYGFPISSLYSGLRTYSNARYWTIETIKICILDLRSGNNVITTTGYKYQDYTSKSWNESDNICRRYETFIAIIYGNSVTKAIERLNIKRINNAFVYKLETLVDLIDVETSCIEFRASQWIHNISLRIDNELQKLRKLFRQIFESELIANNITQRWRLIEIDYRIIR